MPTYVYLCDVNNEEFEEFHSIKIVLDECVLCKTAGKPAHKPKRLISGGSGRGIVELTGHELVQKTKEDARKFKQEVYSSEKQYANVLGEGTYQNLQTKMDKHK
jgi:hypothetical protein